MTYPEQQQDALEAARDEAAAELRAIDQEVDKIYSRKPTMAPGALVAPKRGCDPLRSGGEGYLFAVVASVEPFFLVSEQGDMLWSQRRPEDFDVVGEATTDMLDAVEKRLDYETLKSIHEEAGDLVRRAAEAGVVITIEQVPRKPLAMGHYDTSISVRTRRS